MIVDQQMQILLNDPWFSSLPSDLQATLAKLSVRRYRNGELIHGKGEKADGIYGLLHGQARVYSLSPTGKEFLLTILEPGSWFGITSQLDRLPHTHDVIAQGETDVLRMSQADCDQLINNSPQYSIFFARWAALALRKAFEGVEDVSLLSLEALLAKRIVNLITIEQGTHAISSTQVTLSLPQSELANLLGTTRQSINKQLKQWEIEGLIKISYGRIVLTNLEGLRSRYSISS